MAAERSVILHKWDEVKLEKVTDVINRKVVTGDRVMMAHVLIKKDAIVPQHSHENEQFTYILDGCLRFWIGAKGEQQIDVAAGEVLHIPSNVPHKAQALEDTLDLDVFSPPRQDWLDGTDAYFHKK